MAGRMIWVTIKFTAPRQYVNFLACICRRDEAKSELQAADNSRARDLSWAVVAMRQRFVVFERVRCLELLETSGVGCGLALRLTNKDHRR